jgi:hypothetical protein
MLYFGLIHTHTHAVNARLPPLWQQVAHNYIIQIRINRNQFILTHIHSDEF